MKYLIISVIAVMAGSFIKDLGLGLNETASSLRLLGFGGFILIIIHFVIKREDD